MILNHITYHTHTHTQSGSEWAGEEEGKGKGEGGGGLAKQLNSRSSIHSSRAKLVQLVAFNLVNSSIFVLLHFFCN